MEQKEKFTIILADGTRLINLTMNGNNFIADHVIADEVLSADNLIGVTINDEYHDQMVLDGKTDVDGENTWFILRDMTAEELKDLDIAAKLDYLAMEMGVEL
nr:MAG TPA: hypothetical protein [Caudoviricetes sp.]